MQPSLAAHAGARNGDRRVGRLAVLLQGELERDVQAIGFLSLTIVRPSIIGGQRSEHRLGESIALHISKVLGPILPKKFRISSAHNIAQALIDSVVAGKPGHHFRFAESLL
jgi:hypothetical protein